ncbi:hypothetical protein AN191_03860 [Loktanella sp. 5RATIMAR09]|nr:hypothetical protein AN191_03860 [Loktanella sp. 5RATIMAR09]
MQVAAWIILGSLLPLAAERANVRFPKRVADEVDPSLKYDQYESRSWIGVIPAQSSPNACQCTGQGGGATLMCV